MKRLSYIQDARCLKVNSEKSVEAGSYLSRLSNHTAVKLHHNTNKYLGRIAVSDPPPPLVLLLHSFVVVGQEELQLSPCN